MLILGFTSTKITSNIGFHLSLDLSQSSVICSWKLKMDRKEEIYP